jgi:hypothetical protein
VVIVGAGAAGSAAAAGSSLTTVRSLFCQNLLAHSSTAGRCFGTYETVRP